MNLHPPLSGFPFVLLSLVLGAEIISLFWHSKKEQTRNFGYIALAVALLVTPLTYLSGYFDALGTNESLHTLSSAISEHQSYGKLLLFSMVPCLILASLRKGVKRGIKWINLGYWVTLIICCSLVIATSMRGGWLVFKHGAGVEFECEQCQTKEHILHQSQ